jgi:hypothetical protein
MWAMTLPIVLRFVRRLPMSAGSETRDGMRAGVEFDLCRHQLTGARQEFCAEVRSFVPKSTPNRSHLPRTTGEFDPRRKTTCHLPTMLNTIANDYPHTAIRAKTEAAKALRPN